MEFYLAGEAVWSELLGVALLLSESLFVPEDFCIR